MRRPPLGALVALVVGTDVASKIAARQLLDERTVGPAFAQLDLGYNSGVAFGFLAGRPAVAAALAFIAAAILVVAVSRGLLGPRARLPAALVLAGAAGNLIDRLDDGVVTDFVDVASWPPFNLADAAITVGIVLMLFRATISQDATPAH